MERSKDIRTADLGGCVDLLCPRCGADNLHHGKTTFYNRREDAEEVTLVVVTGDDVEVKHRAANVGNPSSRRHGLRIEFECEQCQGAIWLTLAQHKGSTEIGWEFE